MKKVNLLVYKPGYGGHFIEFLLSLDSSTMPWAGDDLQSRKEQYSFKNIVKKHGTWQNHHIPFRTNTERLDDFFNEPKYDTFCVSIHPHEYYEWDRFRTLHETVSVDFMQVVLSHKYEPVIDAFKVSHGNFPVLRPGEDERDQQFNFEHHPFMINFDNFILGEDTFLEEYTRINEHLALPLYTDIALELYRDWYNERRFDAFLRWYPH